VGTGVGGEGDRALSNRDPEASGAIRPGKSRFLVSFCDLLCLKDKKGEKKAVSQGAKRGGWANND
jgi:hypothetical protein